MPRLLTHLAICLTCLLTCRVVSAQADQGEDTPVASGRLQLYLLIGQSNMAGRGKVSEADRATHPRVFVLDRHDQWVPATEPLHFDKPFAGVGPGLAFGKAMAEAEPEATIGLIPCAAGGSPIRVWQAGEYWKQTDSHPYDDMLRRVAVARQRGDLAGVLWHQGEADSGQSGAAAYPHRLDDLIARLRQDLEAPDLLFVAGGMSDGWMLQKPGAIKINQALTDLPARVPNTAFVSAEGLTLKDDNVHFNAASARELGLRFADTMYNLQHASISTTSSTQSEASP